MTRTLKHALAVIPFLLSVACTNPDKLPAETAIKAAEAAAAAVTAEVEKLAPDQAKAFQEGLASAKAAVAKQDFKAARAAAEPLVAKAQEAVAAARAKAEELKKAATEGVTKVGEKITALQTHLAELGKAKKLPEGVTKEAVAKAKESVTELEAGLGKAREQAATDAAGAATALKDLAAKATETAASLKMP
ncbi:MAG TPA: hypothetical protein VLT61_08045 [Anaeromyxobacteraceae bacterium]|nr:hypothetical protein [Anaeromyxobacteraceae bacterium]